MPHATKVVSSLRRSLAFASVIMLGGLGACAAGPGEPAPMIADSTGIAICRSVPAVEFSQNEMPLAVLGGVESDTVAIFSQIRDLTALRDGRIVVGDQDRSIRWYGEDGELVHRVGRAGDGPGEFREIHLVRRIRGDTIATFDFGLVRISYFDAAGEYVRDQQIILPSPFFVPYDIAEDGRLLFAGMPDPVASPNAPRNSHYSPRQEASASRSSRMCRTRGRWWWSGGGAPEVGEGGVGGEAPFTR